MRADRFDRARSGAAGTGPTACTPSAAASSRSASRANPGDARPAANAGAGPSSTRAACGRSSVWHHSQNTLAASRSAASSGSPVPNGSTTSSRSSGSAWSYSRTVSSFRRAVVFQWMSRGLSPVRYVRTPRTSACWADAHRTGRRAWLSPAPVRISHRRRAGVSIRPTAGSTTSGSDGPAATAYRTNPNG